MEKSIFSGGHFEKSKMAALEALNILGPIKNLKVLGQAITTTKMALLSGASPSGR